MTKERAFGSAIAAAIALGVAACDGEVAEAVGRTTSAIVHGAPSGPEHDAVVFLARYRSGEYLGGCTATLVAPNLVLTARHCVTRIEGLPDCRADGSARSGGRWASDLDPADMLVYTGEEAIGAAKSREMPQAEGVRLVYEESETLCGNDLAFLLLDRPIDGRIAPLRRAGGPRAGETLTVVGWGITESGELPKRRLARSNVRVANVGPFAVDANTGLGITAGEFLVGESGCFGDSGGPAFSETGALVGVLSRGGGGQGDPSNPAAECLGANALDVRTHFATKSALIEHAFALAGHAPMDDSAPPDQAAAQMTMGAEVAGPSGVPTDAPSDADAATSGCTSGRRPFSSRFGAPLGVALAIACALRRRRRAA